MDLADGLRRFRSGQGPTDAPAGHAVGFRHSVDDDGAISHSVDSRHGNVLGAVVQNVLVNLVGDAIGIPANAEIADELELAFREYFSRRIIRRVQDDGFSVSTE